MAWSFWATLRAYSIAAKFSWITMLNIEDLFQPIAIRIAWKMRRWPNAIMQPLPLRTSAGLENRKNFYSFILFEWYIFSMIYIYSSEFPLKIYQIVLICVAGILAIVSLVVGYKLIKRRRALKTQMYTVNTA